MALEKDRIERAITIAATPERIWEIITTPEYVSTWFGTGSAIGIDLRPGGEMTLDHGAHGRYRTVFVVVDPPHRLSYRWAEGYPDARATDVSSTLVEFVITPLSAVETRLTVIESGFASLVVPAGREFVSYDGHVNGWPHILDKLAACAEGRDMTPIIPAA